MSYNLVTAEPQRVSAGTPQTLHFDILCLDPMKSKSTNSLKREEFHLVSFFLFPSSFFWWYIIFSQLDFD